MPCTTSFGISGRFQPLFPGRRQIIYVLLTLAPLYGVAPIPFDLHASSTPSAFDLNQDQILKKNKLLMTSEICHSTNSTQACIFYTLLFFYCQNSLDTLGVLFASFIFFLIETKLRTYLKRDIFSNFYQIHS
jgi:hypothetical protein